MTAFLLGAGSVLALLLLGGWLCYRRIIQWARVHLYEYRDH